MVPVDRFCTQTTSLYRKIIDFFRLFTFLKIFYNTEYPIWQNITVDYQSTLNMVVAVYSIRFLNCIPSIVVIQLLSECHCWMTICTILYRHVWLICSI